MEDNDPKALITALKRAAFIEGVAMVDNYWPLIKEKPDYEAKKDRIEKMVLDNYLDWPTMANLVDWFEINIEDLDNFKENREFYPEGLTIASCDFSIAGECHSSAALNWINRQDLEIHSGFADSTHFHSWLYCRKTNTVYETTPIARERYLGARQDEVQFCVDSIERIHYLNSIGVISKERHDEFCDKTNQLY